MGLLAMPSLIQGRYSDAKKIQLCAMRFIVRIVPSSGLKKWAISFIERLPPIR